MRKAKSSKTLSRIKENNESKKEEKISSQVGKFKSIIKDNIMTDVKVIPIPEIRGRREQDLILTLMVSMLYSYQYEKSETFWWALKELNSVVKKHNPYE